MDEGTRLREGRAADEIDLGRVSGEVRRALWKIVAISGAVGVLVLLVSFLLPNRYRAEATVAPSAEETQPSLSLAPLAASFGVSLGAPSRVEDLEALFTSRDLAVRVFEGSALWAAAAPRRFNPETGTMKPSLTGRLFRGESGEKPPDAWEAIWAAEEGLRVTVNRKIGTLKVSFESPSPEGAAAVVRQYLAEGKSRLQEDALERAGRNKRFIAEQIARTADPLTRDRLYSLYGHEVEREMLARNREQFAFSVIDSPRVPVRKSGPRRVLLAFFATIAAGTAASLFFLFRGRPGGAG